MITAIIDHPRGGYPKWPRVFTAETQENFDAQVRRTLAGVKAAYGAKAAAELTVKIVLESGDVSSRYREPAE